MGMKTLNREYFKWLTEQIFVPPERSFNELFELLHKTEFRWTVPNDNNRIKDGLDLRTEFLNNRSGSSNRFLDLEGGTVLEVLVALSRRLAFNAGGTQERWAYKLLKNLRLHKMFDPLEDNDVFKIGDILDALIWRTYKRDGSGGFFPMTNPEEDQTKVEIWYQMNQYLLQKNPL